MEPIDLCSDDEPTNELNGVGRKHSIFRSHTIVYIWYGIVPCNRSEYDTRHDVWPMMSGGHFYSGMLNSMKMYLKDINNISNLTSSPAGVWQVLSSSTNRVKHDHALPRPASNLSFLWSLFRKSKTMPSSTNEYIHPNLRNSAGATGDTAVNCHSSSHAKGCSAPSASTVASSSSSASALSLIRPPESTRGSGIATDATHQVVQFNANDEATEGNQSPADTHCPSDEISYWLGLGTLLQSQQTRFVNCLHDEQEKNKALNVKLELYAAALGYHHASNIVNTEQLNWSGRCMREALRLRDHKLGSAQLDATTEKHQSK